MKLVNYIHYLLSWLIAVVWGPKLIDDLDLLRSPNLEPLLVPEVRDKSSTITTFQACLLHNTQHSLDRVLGTHRTFEMRCICNKLRDHRMIWRRYFKSETGSLSSAIVTCQLTQVPPCIHNPWTDR